MKFKYELRDIENAAKILNESLNSKVIIFNGDMGSGKTTLISSLVCLLGCKSNVSSPTFSIVNEYEIINGHAYHFDFYRLKNYLEALDLGVNEYFNSGHWNFIEWPEKIHSLLPQKFSIVDIKIISDTERELILRNK